MQSSMHTTAETTDHDATLQCTWSHTKPLDQLISGADLKTFKVADSVVQWLQNMLR